MVKIMSNRKSESAKKALGIHGNLEPDMTPIVLKFLLDRVFIGSCTNAKIRRSKR